jgi:hypothetical protein
LLLLLFHTRGGLQSERTHHTHTHGYGCPLKTTITKNENDKTM